MNGETYTALCHDQQNLHSSALRIPIRIRAWLKLSIILLLSLQNCSSPVKPDQAGITVATANLLIGNTQGKTRVTESLLSRSADVLVLNEACPKTNIDTVMLRDAGYQFKFLAGSSGAFSILMASRISAQFGCIHMSYPVGYDMLYAPFGLARICLESDTVSVVGVHIPPPFYFSKSVRKAGFDTLAGKIRGGLWNADQVPILQGDPVVLAGDFNSFPSDMFIGKLLNTGLEDGAIVNRNPYDYTFRPLGGGGFARIDYTLVSKHLSMQYQENFEIPGSDHRGVMVWIDFLN